MAYSRTYSGWRYRYRYGSRSTRRWRSGNRRRATGNAIAARHQRDAATVTINRIGVFTVNVPINGSSGSTAYSLWNELRNSEFYSNYAPMYDQVKMDKVRLKITGFRAGSAQTDNISPSVVLAFDRNGIDPSQTVTANLISTYSSAQLKQWSNGNSFTMYQTIYPSTIMEKGQYIPTGSLADPTTVPASSNPCSPTTDPTLPFKPITLIGVDLGAAAAAAQTFAFNVEFEYTVTFRGMRKPSLSSSPVLEPFADTFTSNGRHTVTAEQLGVDGFDSIDIVVNVQPDADIDNIRTYSTTGAGYYDLTHTYVPSDFNWTTTTSDTSVTIPPYSFILVYTGGSVVFPDSHTVGTLRLYVNNSSTQQLTVQEAGRRVSDSHVIVGYQSAGSRVIFTLNSGSDNLFYSGVTNYGAYTTSAIGVDDEDFSAFLN